MFSPGFYHKHFELLSKQEGKLVFGNFDPGVVLVAKVPNPVFNQLRIVVEEEKNGTFFWKGFTTDARLFALIGSGVTLFQFQERTTLKLTSCRLVGIPVPKPIFFVGTILWGFRHGSI